LSCPLGTRGEARWKCSTEGEDWDTPSPDLSHCRSIWLLKIHDQLKKKSVSVVHLAKEMSHYTASNPLYGGDVLALIDAIGVITEKMLYELSDIPTLEQREAVVMEIVQSVIKTASIMVSESNRAAWMDLQDDGGVGRGRKRTLTHFTSALKNAGLLLPMAVRENQEVTVSSPNIRKFLCGINILTLVGIGIWSKL
jgi:latrophilin 1